MKKLLLAASIVVFAGCASPADDLEALCDEATKFKTQVESGEGEYAELNPENKARVLATNMEARLKSTEMKQAFKALASAAPDQKYKLMQGAAADVGVENWECPALAMIFAPAPTE